MNNAHRSITIKKDGYKPFQYTPDFNMSFRMDINSMHKAIKRLNRFNYGEIDTKVREYETYSRQVVIALNWFIEEHQGLYNFQRNYGLDYAKRLNKLPQEKKTQIINIVNHRLTRSKLKLSDQVKLAVAQPQMSYALIDFEPLNIIQGEFEDSIKAAYTEVENRKKQTKNLELEKSRIEAEERVKHDIEQIKIDSNQKLKEEEEVFAKRVDQMQIEFDAKVEQAVQDALLIERPRKEEEWKSQLIQRQNFFIEEEVNKRLKKQIKNTLERKDKTSQEEIKLNNLKYQRAIDKMESEYKGLISKMEKHQKNMADNYENKISSLIGQLKETIANYEALFDKEYRHEIEARAKVLAKEYLKKEFPFE